MQQLNLKESSEMVSFAGYDPGQQVLYLTYQSGPTTIAYQNVAPELFEELRRAAYPDVCIRFKIQAQHPFRRIEPVHEGLDLAFLK